MAPVKVLPNPNVDATAAQYAAKDAFVSNITEMIRDIHESVNAMRSAKKQVAAYEQLLSGNDEAQALLDTAKALGQKIADWENNLIQPKQKTFQDVINYENQLNAQFMRLKGFADNPDHPMVTAGAKERYDDLKKEWQEFSDQKTQLIDVELKAFNDMYKELDLPAVIMPEE